MDTSTPNSQNKTEQTVWKVVFWAAAAFALLITLVLFKMGQPLAAITMLLLTAAATPLLDTTIQKKLTVWQKPFPKLVILFISFLAILIIASAVNPEFAKRGRKSKVEERQAAIDATNALEKQVGELDKKAVAHWKVMADYMENKDLMNAYTAAKKACEAYKEAYLETERLKIGTDNEQVRKTLETAKTKMIYAFSIKSDAACKAAEVMNAPSLENANEFQELTNKAQMSIIGGIAIIMQARQEAEALPQQ